MCSVPAVVLAAGLSTRMGALKQLLPIGGRPMVARAIENILQVGCYTPVFVVLGHRKQEIQAALSEFRVEYVENPEFATGEMFSSVQTGLRSLPHDAPACLLALGDQPGVRPSTLRHLHAAWQTTRPPVVTPRYAGKGGHPILISAACVREALALPPGATLRGVILRHKAESIAVPVDDPFVGLDVDTPEEYEHVQALLAREISHERT